ncbi:hypothetical protein A2U01_0108382, partial [Trifolium medium]|nr:hypothetical protein [Trifolium medium]
MMLRSSKEISMWAASSYDETLKTPTKASSPPTGRDHIA